MFSQAIKVLIRLWPEGSILCSRNHRPQRIPTGQDRIIVASCGHRPPTSTKINDKLVWRIFLNDRKLLVWSQISTKRIQLLEYQAIVYCQSSSDSYYYEYFFMWYRTCFCPFSYSISSVQALICMQLPNDPEKDRVSMFPLWQICIHFTYRNSH